jgi:hypothetical protein
MLKGRTILQLTPSGRKAGAATGGPSLSLHSMTTLSNDLPLAMPFQTTPT